MNVLRAGFAAGLIVLSVLLAGCSLEIPRDPNGTLERVHDGILRVGVSHHPPFTDTGESEPTGTEVELVERFAATLDANVEWTIGGEEELVAAMENGEYDVLIGGFTEKSPWFEKVSLTGPYVTKIDARGQPENYVMAVPLGENAFLVTLEDFLQHSDVTP